MAFRLADLPTEPEPTDDEMRQHEIRERRRYAPRCSGCGAFARLAAGVSLYTWQGEYDPYVDCSRCGRRPMGGPN